MPDPTSRSTTTRQGLPFGLESTYAEKAILAEIRRMRGEPVHVRELVDRFSMPERLVRKCVSNLVKQGEPILSSGKGFWQAQTKEEIDESVASYMRSAASLFKRAWQLKKGATYEEMSGHLKLALEEK